MAQDWQDGPPPSSNRPRPRTALPALFKLVGRTADDLALLQPARGERGEWLKIAHLPAQWETGSLLMVGADEIREATSEEAAKLNVSRKD